jgi:iron complex outermembrane receptor protein
MLGVGTVDTPPSRAPQALSTFRLIRERVTISWSHKENAMSRNVATIFFVALLVGAQMGAFAQDSGVNGTVDGEASSPEAAVSVPASSDEALDFVVTAGRTREAANKVAGQVTVITADEIAESGATSVTDILATVPGISFQGGMFGPGSESISMRGFGENSGGRVLVLVDGAKINNPDMGAYNWNVVSLSDIERIEVLDGSASVQYGNYAVGGVVNIITRKSGKTQKTSLTASTGSFSLIEARFSHYRPTSWGAFSLSGGHTGSQGYRKHQAGGMSNAALEGNIDISEAMGLSVRGAFTRIDYESPGWLYKAQFDKDPTSAQLGRWGYDSSPPYATIWIDDPATSYKDGGFEYDASGGVDWTWVLGGGVEFNFPLAYTWKAASSTSDASSDYPAIMERTTNSLELRPKITKTFDFSGMNLRALGGVDFNYVNLANKKYDSIQRTGDAFSCDVSAVVLGPYVSLSFEPISALTFNAGARYDATFQTSTKNQPAELTEKTTLDAFVYDVGASFHPVDFLKVYAKFATLFRYPFTDETASWYGTQYDYYNVNIKPEKGFNTEGGVRVNYGTLVEVNANVYYMQLEDEIAYGPEPASPTGSANINLDKTQRVGVNAGLTVNPVSFIALDGAYSFVKTSFVNGANEGKEIPLVPQHAFYLSLMAKLPFGLSFGPNLEYRGERFFGGDFANAYDRMEAYALWGVKVRYVLDREKAQYALQFTAKNLADTHHASYGNIQSYSPEVYYYYPDAGRTFNVSLQVRF